jgi:hypothetical protein
MEGYQGAPIRQPVAMTYLCAGKLINTNSIKLNWILNHDF